MMKLLVANRGEIAIRIIRAAAELDIPTVAIYPDDDAGSLHTGKADTAVTLTGVGTAAYLDIEQIVQVAQDEGCDAVHPGYGFLSENPHFATALAEQGIVFIGPGPEAISRMGDKITAKGIAAEAGVNTIPGYTDVVRDSDHAAEIAAETQNTS